MSADLPKVYLWWLKRRDPVAGGRGQACKSLPCQGKGEALFFLEEWPFVEFWGPNRDGQSASRCSRSTTEMAEGTIKMIRVLKPLIMYHDANPYGHTALRLPTSPISRSLLRPGLITSPISYVPALRTASIKAGPTSENCGCIFVTREELQELWLACESRFGGGADNQNARLRTL